MSLSEFLLMLFAIPMAFVAIFFCEILLVVYFLVTTIGGESEESEADNGPD